MYSIYCDRCTLNLRKVIHENKLYDATIRITTSTGTKDILVNKLLLSSSLSYFNTLFYGCDNDGSSVYNIPEDAVTQFELLILFVTGECGESITMALDDYVKYLILFEKYGGKVSFSGRNRSNAWWGLVDVMQNSSDLIQRVYTIGWGAPIIKRAIKHVICELTNRQLVYSIIKKILHGNGYEDLDFRQFIYNQLEYRLVA